MAKKRQYASGNALGVCEKLFNAFSISPAIRPLHSLTFRQQQQGSVGADTYPKDRAAVSVKAAAAASPMPRPQAGKVDIECVPELMPKQTKDINDKVEDYINQTKIKFRGSSHYVP